MKYGVTTRLNNLEGDQLEKIIKDITEELDEYSENEATIKFSDDIKVLDFKDLIIKFFYNKTITFDKEGEVQCISGKRRSIIDFYLIQKYYLEQPLSLKECREIYFDLDRGIKKVTAYFTPSFPTKLKKESIKERIDLYYNNNLKNYYCTNVSRNVFVYFNSDTTEIDFTIIDKYNHHKLKQHEEVQVS